MSAAVDALSEFGVKHIDMMLRPEKLWRIIQGGRVMIPMAFDYAARDVGRRCDREARRVDGGGKLIAGGHSLVPLMKLRLSEPGSAHRHRAHSRAVGHQGEGRADRDRRDDGASRRRDVDAAARQVPDRSPRPPRRSAIRRCAIAARIGGSLAHADPAADYPAVMLALDADIQLQGPGRRAHR